MAIHVRVLRDVSDLHACAHAWDELWQRSDVLAPSARASGVALWREHFAPNALFAALLVERDGTLVGALPLVERRVRRVVRLGGLPVSPQVASGDLLLDPACAPEAAAAIVEALPQLPWSLLLLEEVPWESERWRLFAGACQDAGTQPDVRAQHDLGLVEIGSDWKAYEAGRDGDFRRSRRRYSRLLEAEGEVVLRVLEDLEPAEVEGWLRRGFEVEQRSWKGEEGTAVLDDPPTYHHCVAEARQMAAAGQLVLVFLELDEEPIGFVYGWRAKGAFFTVKLGYDGAFRKFGPGQQMMMRLLERLHADPGTSLLDFWGGLAPWSEAWCTRTIPLSQVSLPTRHTLAARCARAALNRRSA